MNGQIFEEVQTFRQPLLWGFMALIFLFVVGGQIYVIAARGTQATWVQWLGLSLGTIIVLAVAVLLYICKLETRVDAGGVHTRFYPLELSERIVPLGEAAGWRKAAIRPLRDHGGWGIRYGKVGKAYIVSGDEAVIFDLKNGKRLVVGTRRPDEFIAALKEFSGGK